MAYSRARDSSSRYGDRMDQTLIVTYMTTTGARRTLAMPRSRAYGLMAVVVASTVWTIASGTWLVASVASGNRSVTANTDAATQHVAAFAGPIAVTRVSVAAETKGIKKQRAAPAAVLSVGDDVIMQTATSATSETTATAAVAATAKKAPAADVVTTAVKSSPAMSPSVPAVAVTGFHVDRIGRAMVASFNVENRGKGAATGRAWGIATFIDESGKPLVIASHAGVDAKDPVNTPSGGVSFSAKIKTAKELSFHVPAGAVRATSIAVYVGTPSAPKPLVATYAPGKDGDGAVWR